MSTVTAYSGVERNETQSGEALSGQTRTQEVQG